MIESRYVIYPGPHGWIGMVGSNKGLCRLSMKPTPEEILEDLAEDLRGTEQDDSAFAEARECLDRYFLGDTGALNDIALDLSQAPPFFGAAWEACRRIPAGETRSYAWLAAEAGRPNAARAAGQAMARNPLALVIPCHRVIGSSGDLHGYGAGGLAVKARLLQLEQRGPN
ncbi:MAG: methylated-DNA--[protein]-cysteine S-methyltransferase [Chloroflexi bacterium]|nr:methylated-DNA--[protein]-cysteine S-methyltransferase [Chloroflexota bacterium]